MFFRRLLALSVKHNRWLLPSAAMCCSLSSGRYDIQYIFQHNGLLCCAQKASHVARSAKPQWYHTLCRHCYSSFYVCVDLACLKRLRAILFGTRHSAGAVRPGTYSIFRPHLRYAQLNPSKHILHTYEVLTHSYGCNEHVRAPNRSSSFTASSGKTGR